MTSKVIDKYFVRFPLLQPTIQTLDEAGIEWMIGGSGCLYLLGNDRAPDDVDIFLCYQDHDHADQLFGIESYTYRSKREAVRNSNPGGEHTIQLTSGLMLTIEDRQYDLQVTADMLAKRRHIQQDDLSLWLMPPEDVLLIKALLRRGSEVGKHDLKDIEVFLSHYHGLDDEYLQHRIVELAATERVGTTFHQK